MLNQDFLDQTQSWPIQTFVEAYSRGTIYTVIHDGKVVGVGIEPKQKEAQPLEPAETSDR